MGKFLIFFLFFSMSGLCVYAQSGLDKKIASALKQLNCAEPSEQNPVTVNAVLAVEGDSIAVVVKTLIAAGWHTYQYVPANAPYIPIELILNLPEKATAAGRWQMSPSVPSTTDHGVLIYEKEAWFVRKVWYPAGTAGKIQTGIYYQCCDLRQCLPPTEKTIDLVISSK